MAYVPVDVLAIAAHRDDVELTCGGALLRAVQFGRRTAVLDLTAGEMGSRGSAELREAEAVAAAKILGLSARENLGLPDAGITNTPETRAQLARAIRRFTPRIVIAPAQDGRHPDHRVTSELVRDACFVAGLAKVAPDVPKHRPFKVIYSVSFREDWTKPTFVVDITEVFDKKLAAIACYGSQFAHATQAGEVYPNGDPLPEVVRHQAAHYGSLIRRRYGEPFMTQETMRADDVAALDVSTY